MYERIKRLYKEGKLTILSLFNAVEKGWITEEQKLQILEENA